MTRLEKIKLLQADFDTMYLEEKDVELMQSYADVIQSLISLKYRLINAESNN